MFLSFEQSKASRFPSLSYLTPGYSSIFNVQMSEWYLSSYLTFSSEKNVKLFLKYFLYETK